MVATPTNVPESLFAGDTFAWERDLADYPASAWTLKYYFDSELDSFEITAGAVGDLHTVSVVPATTKDYKAARYRWHARVDNATIFTTVDNGWLVVSPDPIGDKTDWRSHARKMLDAIEATLEGQATKEQLDLISYSIGGTVNVSRDRKLLMEWRDKYSRELKSEDGTEQSVPRHAFIKFGKP